MTRNNPLMRGIPPSHPGATLREIVLPARNPGLLDGGVRADYDVIESRIAI